jgi:HK97 family phage prohead protease
MKNLILVCEAKLSLEKSSKESAPTGKMSARVTTWGAREGADGRKFNYQPEGFMDWAKEFKKEGNPLPMFLNHNDMGMPVGEWTEFNFDKTGMTAEGRLFMNTSAGSDLYEVLKASPNLFGGVSVGAYADEARMVDAEGNPFADDDTDDDNDDDYEGYFQITKGGLKEVSVVMYPNNPNAEIQALEYFTKDGNSNPRQIEKTLRELGLSRKDATTASSFFKKILEVRDAKPTIIEEVPKQSESDAVVTEADSILVALEQRELLKALSNRLK